MFISCVHFFVQELYLLFKVQCQSFAGMITQDSERSFIISYKYGMYMKSLKIIYNNPPVNYTNYNIFLSLTSNLHENQIQQLFPPA